MKAIPKRGTREIFLRPGEYFVGDAGCRIHTLLGSCVSILLWHPGKRVGAMSHFLLSTRGRGGAAEPDGRYGDEALELMLRGLRRAGVQPSECEAMIFGGGNMFPRKAGEPPPARRQPLNVGEANGQAARALLQAHGIQVRSESLFGTGHRRVVFDVATGHAWVRQGAGDSAVRARQEAV